MMDIGDHLLHVPWMPFWPETVLRLVPQVPGVYLLMVRLDVALPPKIVYVGQATRSLLARLTDHLAMRDNCLLHEALRRIHPFCWFYTWVPCQTKDPKSAEKSVINRLTKAGGALLNIHGNDLTSANELCRNLCSLAERLHQADPDAPLQVIIEFEKEGAFNWCLPIGYPSELDVWDRNPIPFPRFPAPPGHLPARQKGAAEHAAE